MTYIESSRAKMIGKLRETDQAQAVAKIGVGGGLAAASAAAAFGAKTKVVLAGLTVAGLAYSVDAVSNTVTSSQILTAGLDNLDCIESAGEQANTLFVSQQFAFAAKRETLAAAVRKLEVDIAAASATPADYVTELPAARQSLAAGEQALGAIDFYASHTPVAGAIVRAARRTITEVNQQLRERSPSVAAIAEAGSVLGTFYSTGTGIGAAAKAAADKVNISATGHGREKPLAEPLAEDQNKLKIALESIGDLALPTTSVATVAACRAQFAAEAPMALGFTAPVDLPAGETKDLSVLSHGTIRPQWTSAVPSDINWSQEIGVLSISAHADAKEGSYRLRLVDYAGHMSDEFALNVHAATATANPLPKQGTIINNSQGVAHAPPPPGR